MARTAPRARLRREVRQLRLERDILSKPAAWFARETGAEIVLWETGGAVRLAAAARGGDGLPLADCG